jgi:5'-nucleotidase
MNILLTNDDGVYSEPIHQLASRLLKHANIYVVAPTNQQSGAGHAFTYYGPLHYEVLKTFPYTCWSVQGTPSDCVKLAICTLKSQLKFDLVISGINDGENAGVAAWYSGTVAGAREGALWQVPAVALSIKNAIEPSLSQVIDWTERFVVSGQHKEISPGTCWNINFPLSQAKSYSRVQFCAMSTTMFQDEYLVQSNVRGRSEFWLTGHKPVAEFDPQSDDSFLSQGVVSIAPLQISQTHLTELERLKTLTESFNANTRES